MVGRGQGDRAANSQPIENVLDRIPVQKATNPGSGPFLREAKVWVQGTFVCIEFRHAANPDVVRAVELEKQAFSFSVKLKLATASKQTHDAPHASSQMCPLNGALRFRRTRVVCPGTRPWATPPNA
jgi:hypothetical protein